MSAARAASPLSTTIRTPPNALINPGSTPTVCSSGITASMPSVSSTDLRSSASWRELQLRRTIHSCAMAPVCAWLQRSVAEINQPAARVVIDDDAVDDADEDAQGHPGERL